MYDKRWEMIQGCFFKSHSYYHHYLYTFITLSSENIHIIFSKSEKIYFIVVQNLTLWKSQLAKSVQQCAMLPNLIVIFIFPWNFIICQGWVKMIYICHNRFNPPPFWNEDELFKIKIRGSKLTSFTVSQFFSIVIICQCLSPF